MSERVRVMSVCGKRLDAGARPNGSLQWCETALQSSDETEFETRVNFSVLRGLSESAPEQIKSEAIFWVK